MLHAVVRRIVGDPNERELRRLRSTVEIINGLEPSYERLSEEELRGTAARLRTRLDKGESLDQLLPDAFAAIREATRRILGKRHYDVQLVAGIVLHQGKIAEMKTGEGKTQVAALPLFLNALTGEGCHLVTPNDYLARLGGGWLGDVYAAVGVDVAVITDDFAGIYDPEFQDPTPHADERLNHWRPITRREAYDADITYGTNNAFGFDYLRDNSIAAELDQQVQRPLHYGIVDEVDSILIDEARTPLIISGPADEDGSSYYRFAEVARRLRRDVDFTVDEKTRTVSPTEEGIEKVERLLGVKNLYDEQNFQLAHHLESALKAQVIFRRDRDYVVKDGQVIIVDEFTGRLQFGRRYSEGLHQAIEAKEGVTVERATKTFATISFQNYFRMYRKLAGMTGTAATEAEEFSKIYKLDVVSVPTHRPMIRKDEADYVFKTEEAKYGAVVKAIQERHEAGQPVLVGTVSIEKSEAISRMLDAVGVPHSVLNAKFHEQEAGIVALAGQRGAVTIATNMAGRGTDIVLGAGVKELGGLHIIGTERHDSRRIDNQLRGRSGRQGDPGSSRFYISLQDDLMRRFNSDRVAAVMNWLNMPDDEPIEHVAVTKAIEGAQTKVEGYNFDLRKHLVEYDDVMNEQRSIIYRDRQKILEGESMRDYIVELLDEEARNLVEQHLQSTTSEEWDLEALLAGLNTFVPLSPELTVENLRRFSRREVEEKLVEHVHVVYEQREAAIGSELMRVIERHLMLLVINSNWVDHLTAVDDLRDGISLRAYGQRDPLVEYKREAYSMWEDLQRSIKDQIVHNIFRIEIQTMPQPEAPREVHTNRGDGIEAAPTSAAPRPQATARRAAPRRPQPRPQVAAQTPGRNDLCYCGSGKKYKKCHGAAHGSGVTAR